MKGERLFYLLGLVDGSLVEAADFAAVPHRRRRWVPLAAAAACLAVVLGGSWLMSFRMGGASSGGSSGSSSAGGSGIQDGTTFMSYAGPVFPLTTAEETALTAERQVTWDFAAGTFQDGTPRQWGANVTDSYTLQNPTEETLDVELLYPFAGSFRDLEALLPTLTVDGAAVQPTLYAGPYSGGFQSAIGSEEGEDTLNLRDLDSWEQYRTLLESGDYQAKALEEYPVLDIPVTVYEFSNFESPHETYRAATQAISFTIDEAETEIFTYGINGGEWGEDGFRRYSYFVPDGVTRETETKMLVVLGEDIKNYTLQGYQDGGCHQGEEIEGVSCTVTRRAVTLDQVLEWICRDYASFYEGMPPESAGFSQEMYKGAAAELLGQYGPLSGAPKDRYGDGRLEDIVGETVHQKRVMYLGFSVTVPAGGSAQVEARFWKEPSFDFACSGSEHTDLQGYDLVTRLGSRLTFTGQTARLENTENIEIARDNFGFDLENGVAEVPLREEHYYLEIRERE